ncbi:probable CCR4-associated factor 1 homolog 11 [Oryza brachyantha]|uniref:Uncharacterized protein n=1 Tax=Oryza brachyantha TaxID=4533 RepID=J3N0N8_ORYBR|nr:probable CCR4-associated factor 1 homolog 11 [Oryza brachyantha]
MGWVLIRPVTAYNLTVEMNAIRSLISYFPYITIRAEYVDVVSALGRRKNLPPPANRYKLAKAMVDGLDVFQLGITLCDHNGRLPVTVAPDGSDAESAWQVAFSDFDPGGHMESPAGVPAAAFARALLEHGIVSAENRGRLTWVAFGGLYDFGFLLKLLSSGAPLPETGEGFARMLRRYLGNVYDAKYVASRLPVAVGVDLSGGLVSVARLLGAPAVAVEEPRQAGEKSLVACEVFMRMTGLFFAYHDVAVHLGMIDGVH